MPLIVATEIGIETSMYTKFLLNCEILLPVGSEAAVVRQTN